jgi:pantoate--beta-alanine ligase
VREADGLALSSRNAYLSPAERQAAPTLQRTLVDTARRIAGGEAVAAALAAAGDALARAGFKIDYVEAVDAETLAPLTGLGRPARLLAAAWLGKTRLIDNVPIG